MDYRNDNNPSGVQAVKDALGDRVPAYVEGLEKEATHKPEVFVLDLKREFPRGTPNEVWHSYAYLKTANTGYSDGTNDFIDQRLRLTGASMGVEDDLCAIDMVVADINEKKAAKEEKSHFALIVEKAGDSPHKLFPIKTSPQIRKSAQAVHKDANIPLEWKKLACENIARAAQKAKIPLHQLPETISIYGVMREPNFKIASEVSEYRAELVEDKEVGELYKEIAKSASHDSEEALHQYIDLMLDLDRAMGLDQKYGKGVVDPYQAFLSGPETEEIKQAAQNNVLLLDTLVPTEVFAELKEHVHTVFSKKAADSLKKTIELAETGEDLTRALQKLPLDTQHKIMQLAIDKT